LFNYLQKLLKAIIKTVGIAKERYLNAPRDWQEAIKGKEKKGERRNKK
jgi:hypothetical protein